MLGTGQQRQERLRALLLAEKERLWSEVRETLFRQQGGELHAQYDFPQDSGEQGILDLLGDTALALVEIQRQQLTQLDEALARLEGGNYGLCEDCGEIIPEQRLQIVPYAACCVRCQTQREGPAPVGLTL